MDLVRKTQKIIVLVIAVFLLSTSLVSAGELKGTVIASEGIVRKTTSFNGEVIEKLDPGTVISVLESKDQWHYIQVPNSSLKGWIYEELVVVEKSDKSKKGITTASVLNVRQGPSTSTNVVTRLNRGSEVIITDVMGVWFQIKTPQLSNGWVHSDFVKVIPNYPAGLVMNPTALREGKSTASKTISNLKKNDKIFIKGYEDGHYLVVTDAFVEGWVSGKDIELEINVTRPVSRSGERAGMFANIDNITNKYLGKKYGWGQAGPDRFDCSGFTTYIYNTYYGDYLKSRGINLPRTSRDQATVGTNVPRIDLRPGDLVFFNTESRQSNNITHVGIYIGNGQFIHASSARQSVIISSLSENYYNTRFIKAVRL